MAATATRVRTAYIQLETSQLTDGMEKGLLGSLLCRRQAVLGYHHRSVAVIKRRGRGKGGEADISDRRRVERAV